MKRSDSPITEPNDTLISTGLLTPGTNSLTLAHFAIFDDTRDQLTTARPASTREIDPHQLQSVLRAPCPGTKARRSNGTSGRARRFSERLESSARRRQPPFLFLMLRPRRRTPGGLAAFSDARARGCLPRWRSGRAPPVEPRLGEPHAFSRVAHSMFTLTPCTDSSALRAPFPPPRFSC
jgi:hypothetical protein